MTLPLTPLCTPYYIIAFAFDGQQFTSEAFAAHLQSLAVSSQSALAFLIGCSLGLDTTLLTRAHLRLSFSKMTFPH